MISFSPSPEVVVPRLSRLQRSRCCACESVGRLVIDHCHVTGVIRGLLCRDCNWEESQTNDPDLAEWFLSYRAFPPARHLGPPATYSRHLPVASPAWPVIGARSTVDTWSDYDNVLAVDWGTHTRKAKEDYADALGATFSHSHGLG